MYIARAIIKASGGCSYPSPRSVQASRTHKDRWMVVDKGEERRFRNCWRSNVGDVFLSRSRD